MGFGGWLRNVFSPRGATPPDTRRLPALNKSDLSSSLQSLPPGERGWITLREAVQLFSTKQPEYAFGETDEDGGRQLTQFAEERRCDVQFMPMEGRVYFIRKD